MSRNPVIRQLQDEKCIMSWFTQTLANIDNAAQQTAASSAQSAKSLQEIQNLQKMQLALQALQTGLLIKMSATMDYIHAEIINIRRQQAEALAIQQELLGRERLQAFLEELIHQAQKLISECSVRNTSLAPDARYFLVTTLLAYVEDKGIGTPIIRGRDNKAAFDDLGFV